MGRQKANIHYIYKTTCSVTGRWYVGMHSTSNENDGYMGSGTVLRHSIRKYGVDNHTKEILEYCNSREELVLREIEVINSDLISDGKCMNLKEGGIGGFRDVEHMMKCSKAGNNSKTNKIKTDVDYRENYSKIVSLASKTRIANGNWVNPNQGHWKDRNHSNETKRLMSEKAKERVGEANSQYGTCWVTNGSECKKIKKDDLDSFLKEGWNKGRKISEDLDENVELVQR